MFSALEWLIQIGLWTIFRYYPFSRRFNRASIVLAKKKAIGPFELEQVVMNIDFGHMVFRAKERHSYSNRTSITAVDTTAESVTKPIAALDINLQRMTVAGQSDYKVTRNFRKHMNLDSINSVDTYDQLLSNSKPCWNFASLNGC